jgi:putative ABC transport system permease protein
MPVLRQYDPDFILNPVWADDIYSAKFSHEKAISKIITAGTILSLFVALLGLFAIHTYNANRRTKEIGIRKINGGSPSGISMLLSAEIIKVILVSGVIAVPFAWLIADKWLNNYANRVQTGILIFLIPVVVQLVFALLATIWVTIRISLKNPVDSLRYE